MFCTKSSPTRSLMAKRSTIINVTANASANATAMASTTKAKDDYVTFYGRFSRTVGMVIWSIIGMVLICLACSLCWCCCCGLMMFFGGDDVPIDEEEDKELHEVWVRSADRRFF